MKVIQNTSDVLQLSSRTWFWGRGVDVTFDSFMNHVEISERSAFAADMRRFGLCEVKDAVLVAHSRGKGTGVALCVASGLHKGTYPLTHRYGASGDAEKVRDLINGWLNERLS